MHHLEIGMFVLGALSTALSNHSVGCRYTLCILHREMDLARCCRVDHGYSNKNLQRTKVNFGDQNVPRPAT